jgi:hypothetical protein
MAASTFSDFYKSDLQSVYALCVVPLLFLAWLLFSPAAREKSGWGRFLYLYCVVFALETILDPIATGPLTRWLEAGDSALGTAILLFFVLVGDFRVYLLVFYLSRPKRPLAGAFAARPLAGAIAEAAGWTLVVPLFAYATDSVLHKLWPGLPSQTIWLIYELAFLCIAIWLRTGGIARRMADGDAALRRGLEAVAGYAAVYYALWAAADVVILVFGLDAGWALRVIPNQLYYSFYLPFVWFRLSSRR